MPHPDASRWDARYTQEAGHYTLRSPRRLVTERIGLLPPGGLVLDIACGTTPTGLFLASRGWPVIALDVSIAALRLARQRVQKDALPVTFAVMDLTDPWLPAQHFDVILDFYYLSRPLWSTYRKSLKPGGWLFFETFLRQADMNPEHYLNSMELKSAFEDWQIEYYAEIERRTHSRDGEKRIRHAAQLVARKPE